MQPKRENISLAWFFYCHFMPFPFLFGKVFQSRNGRGVKWFDVLFHQINIYHQGGKLRVTISWRWLALMESRGETGGGGGGAACRLQSLSPFVPALLVLCNLTRKTGILSFHCLRLWQVHYAVWPVSWLEGTSKGFLTQMWRICCQLWLRWSATILSLVTVMFKRPTTKWWNRSSQDWLSFWLNTMSKKSYMK